MDINNEEFIIAAEVALNKQAREMNLDFTKPSDYALGWRHCIEWIQKSAALQPSTLPLIEEKDSDVVDRLLGKYQALQNFAIGFCNYFLSLQEGNKEIEQGFHKWMDTEECSNVRGELIKQFESVPFIEWTDEKNFDFLNYIREHEDFYEYVDGNPEYLKKLISSWRVNNIKSVPLIDKGEDAISKCGICGGKQVSIRGKFPNTPNRFTCPTCTQERLDHINHISNPYYGEAVKNI